LVSPDLETDELGDFTGEVERNDDPNNPTVMDIR